MPVTAGRTDRPVPQGADQPRGVRPHVGETRPGPPPSLPQVAPLVLGLSPTTRRCGAGDGGGGSLPLTPQGDEG